MKAMGFVPSSLLLFLVQQCCYFRKMSVSTQMRSVDTAVKFKKGSKVNFTHNKLYGLTRHSSTRLEKESIFSATHNEMDSSAIFSIYRLFFLENIIRFRVTDNG